VNEDEKFHVVVGASGGSGSALVRELTGRNRQVRAVNRSGRATVPPGVEVVAADATEPDRMWEVCRGAAVVYNAINPPFSQWREPFRPASTAYSPVPKPLTRAWSSSTTPGCTVG